MDEGASIWDRLGADINGDGKFTVADVVPYLLDILVIPGDALIGLLITYAPEAAGFLELGTEDYGGTISIWLSILIWLAALIALGTIINAIRALDRRLTAWIVGVFREMARRLRVYRRLLVTSLRLGSLSKARAADSFEVESVRLAADEKLVLRCLSAIEDGAVLTLEEIAAKLGCSAQTVTPLLRHLTDLHLVEHGADKATRREGHRIAVAGQMYLLGA
jgi:DNA-binding MarR family transcriptional regulator